MANTVTIQSLANTFGNWLAATNALAKENNDLAANNYIKGTGTLYLNDPNLGLQVANNAVVAGQLQVQGVGSSVYVQNNMRVDQQVYFTNTTLGIVNSGQSSFLGTATFSNSGTALVVSNNATINGNTQVNTLNANVITVITLNNNYLNAAFSEANTAYTEAAAAYDQANTATIIGQNAFNLANTDYIISTAAYNQANVATVLAQAGFDKANTANVTAQAGFDKANSANVLAQTAYNQANVATISAQAAYNWANTANVTAQAAYNQANANYIYANSAFYVANNALPKAGGTITGTLGVQQNLTVGGNLTVAANLVLLGQTLYDSNTFTLRTVSGQADGISSILAVNRGTSANAQIRWNDLNTYWDIRDVNNPTNYYQIITTQQVSSSINSTSTTNVATSNTVNTVYTYAQTQVGTLTNNLSALNTYAVSGYNQANTATVLGQAAFDSGNLTIVYATSGFNKANAANVLAQAAFNKANSSNVLAQAAFDSGNNTLVYATSGFNQANTANVLAQAAFNFANTLAGGTATDGLARATANAAYDKANTANVLAQAAYANANTILTYAQAAYNKANTTGNITDQSFITANAAYLQANAAYNLANTVNAYSISAYSFANTSYTCIVGTSGQISVTCALNAGNQGYKATLALPTIGGLTPGSYTLSSITVDSYGRITSASSGTVSGTVQSVTAATVAGPSGGYPIGICGTNTICPIVQMNCSGVTSGNYCNPSLISVDAYGRITSVTAGVCSTPVSSITFANGSAKTGSSLCVTCSDITGALGVTPIGSGSLSTYTQFSDICNFYNGTSACFPNNGSPLATQSYVTGRGYITTSGITCSVITSALGFAPSSSSVNVTCSCVTSALGFTPYNASSNPCGFTTSSSLGSYLTCSAASGCGYITSSALSGYATQSYVTSQGYVTSSSLSNYVTCSCLCGSTAGWQKHPSGVIIQWGYNPYWGSVTFPISFPSGVQTIVGTPTTNQEFYIGSYNASGFTPCTNGNTSAFSWIAIGY
jgi:hypothetical protein